MAPVDRELAEESGQPQVLIATSILLDGRTVYGPLELDPRAILLEPETRSALLAPMLRLAQALKLPTGFKGKIVEKTPASIAGPSTSIAADCYPVVDIARFGALKAGADVDGDGRAAAGGVRARGA